MISRLEKKQATRRALIEAALKLASQQSFAALSLREVAREAGVTPTAFYRHFHDLDELGLALVDEVGLSLRQLMRQARSIAGRGHSVVRSSVDTFMEYLQNNANLFRLLLGERSGSSPAFRKALHAEINRFVAELTEDFQRGGVGSADLAAEAIVAVVFTVGAEALDLPLHRRAALSARIVKEIHIILRGARITGRAVAPDTEPA